MKNVNNVPRTNAVGYSGGRVTTKWTPQPQLHAAIELEAKESQTGTADVQTETVSQPVTPPLAPPPTLRLTRVGRGATDSKSLRMD